MEHQLLGEQMECLGFTILRLMVCFHWIYVLSEVSKHAKEAFMQNLWEQLCDPFVTIQLYYGQ